MLRKRAINELNELLADLAGDEKGFELSEYFQKNPELCPFFQYVYCIPNGELYNAVVDWVALISGTDTTPSQDLACTLKAGKGPDDDSFAINLRGLFSLPGSVSAVIFDMSSDDGPVNVPIKRNKIAELRSALAPFPKAFGFIDPSGVTFYWRFPTGRITFKNQGRIPATEDKTVLRVVYGL